jgi:hypothetical protein
VQAHGWALRSYVENGDTRNLPYIIFILRAVDHITLYLDSRCHVMPKPHRSYLVLDFGYSPDQLANGQNVSCGGLRRLTRNGCIRLKGGRLYASLWQHPLNQLSRPKVDRSLPLTAAHEQDEQAGTNKETGPIAHIRAAQRSRSGAAGHRRPNANRTGCPPSPELRWLGNLIWASCLPQPAPPVCHTERGSRTSAGTRTGAAGSSAEPGLCAPPPTRTR